MAFFGVPDTGAEFNIDVVSIATSAQTSTAIDLSSRGLVGFQMPSAFTGTTVTFVGTHDDENGTYQALYNSDNTAFSITVAVDRQYVLCPSDFLGVRYVKFVSGSAEAASRSIVVTTRSFM